MINYKKHLLWFFAGVGLLLATTLVVNLLFDPLWYLKGNQLGKYNYAFNERLSKLNQLQDSDINCIIFGSSRSTFIKARNIKNMKCFNLSFSGGQVEEFVDYARYIKAHLPQKIEYVIVGVDGGNFIRSTPIATPVTARATEQTFISPPSLLKSYLSIDALAFSYRLYQGQQNLPRVYNQQFEVEVAGDIPVFDPLVPLIGAISGDYYPEQLQAYKAIIDILAPQHMLFYTPPLSAWHIADMQAKGILNNYIQSLYSFIEAGHYLIDYSIVSKTTLNVSNTYDGHHFMPLVNDLITQDISDYFSGKLKMSDDFGLYVSDLSFIDYQAQYKKRLNAVKQRLFNAL